MFILKADSIIKYVVLSIEIFTSYRRINLLYFSRDFNAKLLNIVSSIIKYILLFLLSLPVHLYHYRSSRNLQLNQCINLGAIV